MSDPGSDGHAHVPNRTQNRRRTIESVRLRFYVDPATGEPHIYRHNVQDLEVEEILAKPIEDRPGASSLESSWGRRKRDDTFGSFMCRIQNRIRSL